MPTTAEVRAMWDEFADDFEAWAEPRTVLGARQLLAALDLRSARALLEVGGGAGGLARVTRELLPEGARHVVTDLAPRMVELARKKVGDVAEVLVADAEELPFETGAFDRLLASLNLMIVPDTDRALSEALRVVVPGGLAAWSVWGRPDESDEMTIPARAAQRAGIALPEPPRSNFHLAPRDNVVARVRGAGFVDVRAWYVTSPMHVRDGAQYAREVLAYQPRMRALAARLPAEAMAAYTREITALADEVLASGRPIATELCCVVARRPEHPLEVR